MPGKRSPFLRAGPLVFSVLGRRRLVERSLGMDMADEVDVGRQVREDALAAVGAVAGDDDLIVGEPPAATMLMSSRASSGRVR